jgi:hypothetical protein
MYPAQRVLGARRLNDCREQKLLSLPARSACHVCIRIEAICLLQVHLFSPPSTASIEQSQLSNHLSTPAFKTTKLTTQSNSSSASLGFKFDSSLNLSTQQQTIYNTT